MSFLGDDEDMGSLLKGPAKASSSAKPLGPGSGSVQRRPVVAPLDDDEEDFFKEFAVDMDEDDAAPVKPAKPSAAKNKPAIDSDDDQDVMPADKGYAQDVAAGNQKQIQPLRDVSSELKPGLQLDDGSDDDDGCTFKATTQQPITNGDRCNEDNALHAAPTTYPTAQPLSPITKPSVPLSNKPGDVILHKDVQDGPVAVTSHDNLQLDMSTDMTTASGFEVANPEGNNSTSAADAPTGAGSKTNNPAAMTTPAPAESQPHSPKDDNISCKDSCPAVPEVAKQAVHSEIQAMHMKDVATVDTNLEHVTTGDVDTIGDDQQQSHNKDMWPEATQAGTLQVHGAMGDEPHVHTVALAVAPIADTPHSPQLVVTQDKSNDVQQLHPPAPKCHQHAATAPSTLPDAKRAAAGGLKESAAVVNVQTGKQPLQGMQLRTQVKSSALQKALVKTTTASKQLPTAQAGVPHTSMRHPQAVPSTPEQQGMAQPVVHAAQPSAIQVASSMTQSKATVSGGSSGSHGNIFAKQVNNAVKRGSVGMEADEVTEARQKIRKVSNGSEGSGLTAGSTLSGQSAKAVRTDGPRSGPAAFTFKKPTGSQNSARGMSLLPNVPSSTLSFKQDGSKTAVTAAERTPAVANVAVLADTAAPVAGTAQQPGKQGTSESKPVKTTGVVAVPATTNRVANTEPMEVESVSKGSGQLVAGVPAAARKQTDEQRSRVTAKALLGGTEDVTTDTSRAVKAPTTPGLAETVTSVAITTASLQVDDDKEEEQTQALPHMTTNSLAAMAHVQYITPPAVVPAFNALPEMAALNVMPAGQPTLDNVITPNINKMMDDNLSMNKIDKMVLECQQVMLKLAEMRAATAILRNRQVRLDNPLLRARILKLAADKSRAGINPRNISHSITTVKGA